ncbi:class A beta-lactamase [Parachitinimonas caeni]|uniref:beta-lactamase n=1 Tax=Parachitinimonas caeni TaxID=3031301 RepID=A0ABT7E3D9_9NEIS|nr:class A beta-lactamase [Parachitinimonas caeni]MDK2125427.1 class A beta-lactamase [Parachitinimonas caeni]
MTLRISTPLRLGFLALALATISASALAACPELGSNIEQVLARQPQTPVAVAVLEPSSQCTVMINAERAMTMMSVYKLPIVLAAYDAADKGFKLDRVITITPAQAVGGYSPLAETLAEKGPQRMSYSELADEALMESDNTASDVLLKAIGGPEAVNRFLARHQLSGIRVDRFERQITTDQDKLPSEVSLKDERDTATGAALITLLQRLTEGKLLSARSTRIVLEKMAQVQTGRKRLRAGIPETWKLAHKTGTGELPGGINLATHDVGIIYAPGGRKILTAVLVGPSKLAHVEREALIAAVSKEIGKWASQTGNQP